MAILAGQRIRALDYAGYAYATEPSNVSPDPVPPSANTPITPTPILGVAFTCPTSGAVSCDFSGRLTVDPPAVRAYATVQLRTGAVIGSGVVVADGAADQSFEIGGSTLAGNHTAQAGASFEVFYGLTPGSLYHFVWQVAVAVGGQPVGVHGRAIRVTPFHG